MAAKYNTVERGTPNTLDYRVFFTDAAGEYISPFHDIPLQPEGAAANVFNMVVEVSRWTNAKMEIDTGAKLNPIKQDTKKGKLRYVANCYPHRGYIWNYGYIPQTWEDPTHKDANTQCNGDNDPIDVCEIGELVQSQGAVVQVKVLGVLAMVDDGETDWKVIVINTEDPMADKLNNIEDVRKYKPGFLEATHNWFKIYKVPDGKKYNTFAFNGEFKDKDFAITTINETHGFWKAAIKTCMQDGGIEWANRSVSESSTTIDSAAAKAVVAATPDFGLAEEITDIKAQKWYWITEVDGVETAM